jgi:hypothetical protein
LNCLEELQLAPKILSEDRGTSWALDDDEKEVHELQYFENLNKRFNKVGHKHRDTEGGPKHYSLI